VFDEPRHERMVEDLSAGGGRSFGARDRDRILHTYALRRLADVTQVVGPHEGMLFHNRLTHSLEVAQIARRLAERFLRESPEVAGQLGGIDPEVCEAAGLAHDLGHPPFGHIAEKELDALGRAAALEDGFEGNAQSFRILTRLAAHRPEYRGLNLSRATLNAVLKYPWRRERPPHPTRFEKFGAYDDDRDALAFARRGVRFEHRTAEASVMNLADDIAYSVHDFDDFCRAGLLPITSLRGELLQRFLSKWKLAKSALAKLIDSHRPDFEGLLESLSDDAPYEGTFSDRAHFRARSALLIDRFVSAAALRGVAEAAGADAVTLPESERIQIEFLKRLVFEFVIERPDLGAQQAGQRRIIRELFTTYHEAVRSGDQTIVPALFREELQEILARGEHSRQLPQARLALDIVASFTEAQAVAMYRRLTGHEVGSVANLVMRS